MNISSVSGTGIVYPAAPTPEPVLRRGATGDEVVALQSRLTELGYYAGDIDGQFGPGTRDAVTLFQKANGLAADGVVGSETGEILWSAEAKPMESQAPESEPANTTGL